MPKSFEGGMRPYRLEYVSESTEGTAPSDPSWNKFSDNIRSFEPSIDSGLEEQRGLGSADPVDHLVGSGSFELTVTYDLQQKASSGNTFLDGSSNPNDAATDGLQRDTDNRLQNTHTIVRRMDQSDLDAGNTVNGSTAKDTRQYVVYLGASIDTVTITGDPTSGQPIMVELSYVAEKARVYQIDQPGSSTQIDVVSSDSSDTSQTVTIEDEGAGTSEDVSLNGTTTQTTTASFSDIDAVHLSAETTGDITITENGGDDLMVIRGTSSYDFDEGDLGVPALGSGSHASDINQSYEIFQGDTVERPSNTNLGDEINSTEFTVENNLESRPTNTGQRNIVSANERSAQVSGTVFGEVEMFDKLMDSLENIGNDLVWTFGGGSLTLTDCRVMEVSPDTEEANQGIREVDVTFNGEGLTVA